MPRRQPVLSPFACVCAVVSFHANEELERMNHIAILLFMLGACASLQYRGDVFDPLHISVLVGLTTVVTVVRVGFLSLLLASCHSLPFVVLGEYHSAPMNTIPRLKVLL